MSVIMTKGYPFVILIAGIGVAGCCYFSIPSPGPPNIESVMALSTTGGLPRVVPQSLGGEYRALPESGEAGRGIAFDLIELGDTSGIAVFIDGDEIQRGDTTGTLAATDAPRFSVAAMDDRARVTILLPLDAGAVRKRMVVAVAIASDGGRAAVTVDTPSASRTSRPEPSDVFFSPGTRDYYWWQPINPDGKDPTYIVARDVLVAGWLLSYSPTFNADGTLADPTQDAPHRHCENYCEDIHYYLMLDPSFLARTYGRSDRVTTLTEGHLPGQGPGNDGQTDPLPPSLNDNLGGVVGAPSAITINSFAIPKDSCGFHAHIAAPPFASFACLKGEQNVWHVETTPPTSATYFGPHAKGSGPPPTGWLIRPVHPTIDRNTAFAYHPAAGIEKITRSDASTVLRFGDYVIAKATLYQDAPHGELSCFPRSYWHSNWLELHPLDWIARAPAPTRPAFAARVAQCLAAGTPTQTFDQELTPPPDWFASHNEGDTLRYCTLIDERFTTPGQLSNLQISPGVESKSVRVTFGLDPSLQDAAFTASIIMWWAPPGDATLDLACFGSPSN
jgi:hypothetical protein